MKLTVTQENLSRALATVSRIATSRGSLPILSNVLLRTEGTQLYIAATNLDVAISETIGAKIKKEGSITVPARLMLDYVSSLPSGTLELEVVDHKLELRTEHHNSAINGTPADDFPEMPTIESGQEITLPQQDLKSALQQVLFAASSDEARPVLTALFLHSSEGFLYAAATDSYRLAEKKIRKISQDVSLLIPAGSLQDVLRVMHGDDAAATIHYDDQQARFTTGSIQLVTRLIEGVYPDYRKLLPATFETTITLEKQDLQEITKVSSLFAREAAGGVTVTADEASGEVSIKSIASQVGENKATAKAIIHGEATITMNSRYILDALGAFTGSSINMNINGKLNPCVLTDPDDDSYLHVIMPVKS